VVDTKDIVVVLNIIVVVVFSGVVVVVKSFRVCSVRERDVQTVHLRRRECSVCRRTRRDRV